MSLTNMQKLVHELEVRQGELELQNRKLRRNQSELQTTCDRYAGRYSELYDFAPAGHLTLDRNGIVQEANLQAETLLGIPRGELIRQPLIRFIASNDQAAFARHCRDAFRTETRQSCDLQMLRPGRDLLMIHLESQAFPDDTGKVPYCRTSFFDITERKRVEDGQQRLLAELDQSKQHFERIFRLTPSAVAISTFPDGRFLDVNDGLIRLTGYEREELIGHTTAELNLWADPSERPRLLEEIRQQGFAHNREGVLRTKSGELRRLMVSAEPIHMGDQACLIYVAHDITAWKQAEEALRHSHQQYKSLVETIDGIVWEADPVTLRFLFVSPQAERLLGFPKQLWLDEPTFWVDHVHAEDRERTLLCRRDSTAKKQNHECEYRMVAADGRIVWIRDIGTVVTEGDRVIGLKGIMVDITEHRKWEQLEADQKRALELIAKDAPLSTVFEALVGMIEEQSAARMVASILLVDADGAHLYSAAAPSLPEAYNRAIDGIAIGPNAGSCGTAAYRRRPVYVSDIATDPLWEDFAALALSHDLRACWSTPILSSTGRLLGTLAMYYPQVREPNAEDLRLVEVATRMAAIAIERRRAEEALRESEARYRGIVSQSVGGIAETDMTGRFTTVNGRYCEITGYSRDELVGRMRMQDITHPDDLSHGLALLGQLIAQGTAFDIEKRYIRKDGSLVWVHNSESVIRNAAGNAQSLVAVSIDISKRKRVEEERNKQELLISLMLNTGPGCITRVAADGTLLQMNPAGLKLIEAGCEDEAVGLCVYELVVPEHRAAFIDMHRDVLAGRSRTIQFEIQGLKGARRWMESHAAPFSNPVSGEAEHLAVTHDITERKRAERQLRDTLDRVRKLSQRLESVREEERSRIARELHDELGVRLTCLKLDLARVQSLTGESLFSREKMEQQISSMTAEVDATIASVQQLVVELRPGILDDLGLVAAIEWQCEDFERRSGIRCLCEASQEKITLDPSCATTAFRICQEALTNVVRHAKATFVRVLMTHENGDLLLEIQDDGEGISAEKLADARSFGLLGMQERASGLGGRVEIAGQSGKGTTVTVRLPLSTANSRKTDESIEAIKS